MSISLDDRMFKTYYKTHIKGKKSVFCFEDLFGEHAYHGCILTTRKKTTLYFTFENYKFTPKKPDFDLADIPKTQNSRLKFLGIAKQTSYG